MDAFGHVADAADNALQAAHEGYNAATGGGDDAYNTGYQDGLAGAADDAINRVGFGLATYYENGYAAGQQAAAASVPTYDGPSVDNVQPGTVPLDQYEAPGREAIEDLFHTHIPHTDNPDYDPSYADVETPVEQLPAE